MTNNTTTFFEHTKNIGLSSDEEDDYSSDMLCNKIWHAEAWYGKSSIRILDQQNFAIYPHAEC